MCFLVPGSVLQHYESELQRLRAEYAGLSGSKRTELENLLTECDLLEVTMDEVQQLWQLLQQDAEILMVFEKMGEENDEEDNKQTSQEVCHYYLNHFLCVINDLFCYSLKMTRNVNVRDMIPLLPQVRPPLLGQLTVPKVLLPRRRRKLYVLLVHQNPDSHQLLQVLQAPLHRTVQNERLQHKNIVWNPQILSAAMKRFLMKKKREIVQHLNVCNQWWMKSAGCSVTDVRSGFTACVWG